MSRGYIKGTHEVELGHPCFLKFGQGEAPGELRTSRFGVAVDQARILLDQCKMQAIQAACFGDKYAQLILTLVYENCCLVEVRLVDRYHDSTFRTESYPASVRKLAVSPNFSQGQFGKLI